MFHSSNLNWSVKTFSCKIVQNWDFPIVNNDTRQGSVLQELCGVKFKNFTVYLELVHILFWEIYKLPLRLWMWNTPSVCRYHGLKARLAPLFPILVSNTLFNCSRFIKVTRLRSKVKILCSSNPLTLLWYQTIVISSLSATFWCMWDLWSRSQGSRSMAQRSMS